jgi:hypothetical protein
MSGTLPVQGKEQQKAFTAGSTRQAAQRSTTHLLSITRVEGTTGDQVQEVERHGVSDPIIDRRYSNFSSSRSNLSGIATCGVTVSDIDNRRSGP